jgi:hypothetical protein
VNRIPRATAAAGAVGAGGDAAAVGKATMGLRDRLATLFGTSGGNGTVAADQARAQEMHGRETGQTSHEQDGTRQRMEAELDAQRTQRASLAPAAAAGCPHTVLVPRWDSPADLGHEERASGFTCDACHAAFTAAEGHALRQSEAARVRQQLEQDGAGPAPA